MKIIIAKRSGLNEVAYINASRINSFLAQTNQYDGRSETRIFFSEGKCEIEGDRTAEIAEFMACEADCGVLDLVNESQKESAYERAVKNGQK